MTDDILKMAVNDILVSYEKVGGINFIEGENLPSRESVSHILNSIKSILFPGYFETSTLEPEHLGTVTEKRVKDLYVMLKEELIKSTRTRNRIDGNNCEESQKLGAEHAEAATVSLIREIPTLRKMLKEDAEAVYEGDPAAHSVAEVILSYPGFHAITTHRIAHLLYENNMTLVARMMTEIVHSATGIDIHPGAKIGSRFCIDHGTGIVIGGTAIIGNNVKIYQGVTIGALSVKKSECTAKRHPTIEDNVVIYAGTTILGGETVIGEGSIIGGNTWLIKSIPPGSKVYQSPDSKQLTIKEKNK